MGRNHSSEKHKKRQSKPVVIFAGIVAFLAVVTGVWLFNQYKLRKAVEAANEKTAMYTTAAPETITPEKSGACQV